MNAIVPLNVTALRVNANDASNVAVNFKGRVAAFENMPYAQPGVTNQPASTGDQVVEPLESQTGPLNTLGIGVHVHWELPTTSSAACSPRPAEMWCFPTPRTAGW